MYLQNSHKKGLSARPLSEIIRLIKIDFVFICKSNPNQQKVKIYRDIDKHLFPLSSLILLETF